MNKKEYKKISLPELQKIFLVRLKEVIDFLDKNNIEYFAIGGTALGAFRHHGFIPWDNDVDLGMTRDNYEHFAKIASQLENDHFLILGHQFTSPIEHGLIKIGLKGTICPERSLKNKYDTHYHIDIFPYDSVPNDEKLAKKQAKQAKKIKNILYYKSKKKLSSKSKSILLFFYQLFFSLFSSNKFANKLDKIAQKYNVIEPKSYYVTNLMGAYSYEKEKVLRKNIGNPVYMNFDELNIKVPERCSDFLKDVYGSNFMTPSDIRIEMNQYFAYIEKDFKI